MKEENGFVNSLALMAVIALCGCAGKAKLPEKPEPVYSVDFALGAEGCAYENYRNRTVVTAVTNAGAAEVVISRAPTVEPEAKDTAWSFRTADFPVTSGREYVVDLLMAGHLPKAAYINPGARIEWLDAEGKPVTGVDALGKDVPMTAPLVFPLRKPDLGGSRTVTKGFVPDAARRARVFVRADYPDLGAKESLSFRDVSYYEHEKGASWAFDDVDAPELEILTPSPTADASAPIRFRLKDATGVDYGQFTCTIGGRSLAMSDLRREGDVFTYVPSEPWPQESVVNVEVGCADVNGFAATECGFVAISASRVRHAKWTVRDDGVLLRDGTPFFPLGLTSVHAAPWCDGDLDRGLAELKANGVNCVHTYMVRGRKNHAQSLHYDELVAAAEKHGIAFMSEPAVRTGAREVRDPMIAANTLFGRTSAAQWGWGIGDDTSRFETPRDLKRMHRFCKAADPDLLTVSIDATCAAPQQAPYVPFADVLVLEDYPIRKPEPQDEEMAVFAQTLDDGWEAVRLAGTPNRSVMSMPQTFKGWKSWMRYPTKEELRCELYLSLACRARGIITYTSFSYDGNEGPLNRPETKAEYCELTREVAALLPSLVLRDAAEQPEVSVLSGPAKNVRGGDSVRCLLKEDGLLILANSSHKAVKASIRLPSGKVLVRELKRNAGWAERPNL